MRTIDIHAHFFPESWPDFAARFGSPDWPWMKPLGDGEAMIMLGNRGFRRINQACWDPTARLEDLERQGAGNMQPRKWTLQGTLSGTVARH